MWLFQCVISFFRYCIDCDELLCQTCVDFHMKFKSTKGHKLVHCNKEDSFKGAQLLSPYLFCPNHSDRPVEVKCDVHNTLCCLTCATITHRNCHSICEIRQLAGGCKTDGQTDKLRTRIEGINTCIEEIISVNDICRKDFEISNEEIPKTLVQLKSNLMKLYERIEMAVLKETQSLHLGETIATGNREENWKLKLNANANLLKMLDAIQEVGTDSQVYVTVHKIKEILAETEKSLEGQGSQIVGQKLNLKIKDKLDNILKTEITETLVAIESVQNQYQLPKTSEYVKKDASEEVKSSSDALHDSLVESSFEEVAVKKEYRNSAKATAEDTKKNKNIVKGVKEAASSKKLNETEEALVNKWLLSSSQKPSKTQESLLDAPNMDKGSGMSKSDTDISAFQGKYNASTYLPEPVSFEEAVATTKNGTFSSMYETTVGSIPTFPSNIGINPMIGPYSLDSHQSAAVETAYLHKSDNDPQTESKYWTPHNPYVHGRQPARQESTPAFGRGNTNSRSQRGHQMPQMQQYQLAFPDNYAKEKKKNQNQNKEDKRDVHKNKPLKA